jgi:hypothetical protein
MWLGCYTGVQVLQLWVINLSQVLCCEVTAVHMKAECTGQDQWAWVAHQMLVSQSQLSQGC